MSVGGALLGGEGGGNGLLRSCGCNASRTSMLLLLRSMCAQRVQPILDSQTGHWGWLCWQDEICICLAPDVVPLLCLKSPALTINLGSNCSAQQYDVSVPALGTEQCTVCDLAIVCALGFLFSCTLHESASGDSMNIEGTSVTS